MIVSCLVDEKRGWKSLLRSSSTDRRDLGTMSVASGNRDNGCHRTSKGIVEKPWIQPGSGGLGRRSATNSYLADCYFCYPSEKYVRRRFTAC